MYNGHGPIWSINDQTRPTTKTERNLVGYIDFSYKTDWCFPTDLWSSREKNFLKDEWDIATDIKNRILSIINYNITIIQRR